MAVEYNEKIETVNRERKFHQVTIHHTLYWNLNHDHTSQQVHNLFLISKTLEDSSMP